MACSVFIKAQTVDAAWWETKNIPVPAAADKEKEETRIIAGSQMDFTYYTSAQDAAEIKKFYRAKLANLGWQERNFLKDLSQIQLPEGMPTMDTAYLDKMTKSNLLFEKDNETLIITFLPEEYSRDGKTRFNLCQGRKIEAKTELSPDTVPLPVLVAKPKKDVFAVYPEASLLSLNEEARSLRATYLTKDEPEPVISFYKAKMPDYGWYLKSEKPLQKMDANYAASADCPSCKANPALLNIPMETWFAEIDFTNEQGDKCNIAVAEIIPLDKKLSSFKMTTIAVFYQEKPK
jgi:hypothetical protein